MTDIYRLFLIAANCSDVACLRNASSDTMMKANQYLFLDVPPGDFPGPGIGFGPIVDEDLIVALPDQILNNTHGPRCRSNVKRVIAGGIANEGAFSSVGKYIPVLQD